MSAFDIAGDHDSASLMDQARANPLDLSQPAGFFRGSLSAPVTGLGRLAADTQRTVGLALGAVAGSFDMLTGDAIKAQDKVFEHIVAPADKLSRHLAPKPEEVGMAGQLLHGLIKIGGEAIAFGPGGVLVNETVGGTLDALDKGVDLQTAGKVGGVQGAAMTAGVVAPMTLGASGLGLNVGYGAAINLAQGIFQRGATAEIYRNAGRHDLAAQFQTLDREAMMVDALLGAAFAGGGRYLQLRGEAKKADAIAEYKAKIADTLKPSDIDAALVKNEQLKMERSGMGLPADLASRDAHVANLTGAIDDLMEGRPVTMRQEVGNFIPDEAAAKVQEDVAAVLAPDIRGITVYHGTDRPFDVFDPANGGMFTSNMGRAQNYAMGSSGRVIEANLDIRNPMPWADAFGKTPAEIKASGFDGAIQWGANGEVMRAVVVDASQVRQLAPKVGADATAQSETIYLDDFLSSRHDDSGLPLTSAELPIPPELRSKILTAYNAASKDSETKLGRIEDSENISAKTEAFRAMAEAEGYAVGGNYKYLTISKNDVALRVRLSDHANVNKSVHFGESQINIAPSDGGNPVDTFASALYIMRHAAVDADGEVVIARNAPTAVNERLGFVVTHQGEHASTAAGSDAKTTGTIPEAQALRPDAVIPMDDADSIATVAEAQGILSDIDITAREHDVGLRAAVACFLRAA